jgi:uncharacterized membrane protein
MALALQIFERGGWYFLARWAHIVAGITWIGLLYYFNFVQVPSFAQMEAPARNNAIDKLASRALWWFRWAALATFLFGLLLLSLQKFGNNGYAMFHGDYFKLPEGVAIATGILLGVTMFLNVWGVIWPNQKKVIANARNVQAGGEADPNAAAAGRKALLASRMNAIYSFTMLFFMVGAAHFFDAGFKVKPSGSDRGIYWAVAVVIWGVLELNALGVIGGTKPGGVNWMYDTHKAALITGGVLVVVYYFLFYLVLKP